jgi:hypothetical protein
MPPELDHLRLADLSDREVLLALMDAADGDGFASAPDIASQLGMKGDHPQRMVSSRCAWLRRYGAVERELLWDDNGNAIMNRKGEQRTGQRWRPTELGYALARGSLKKAQENALAGLTDEQLVLATRAIAERARGSSNASFGKMTEREWKHRWLRQNGDGRKW